jgi:hypothetical protein
VFPSWGDHSTFLLLLLLLNHLPPDITSGQGLNGFQNLFSFYNTFYNTRDMMNDIFDKTTKMATIFFQKIRNVLAIQKHKGTREYTEKSFQKRDSLRRRMERGAAHFPR